MSSRAGCLHSDERSRAEERSRAPVNLWIPFAVPPALLLALLALQWLERSLFGRSLDRHINGVGSGTRASSQFPPEHGGE